MRAVDRSGGGKARRLRLAQRAVEVVDGDEGEKVLWYSRHDNRGHGSGVGFVHGEGRRRGSVQEGP